jgi:predicted dithiol-disulfide oxidoreductase (DUF899 family)
MTHHEVTTRENWMVQRRALLEREKAFTRAKDDLAAARRALPWVRIDKTYEFDAPEGKVTLGDLFAGNSQLLVYHFMFGPTWELPCKSCSFWGDHISAIAPHLPARDISIAAISRAPLAKLTAFQHRMGWRFRWLSNAASDFAYDFCASFRDGQREAGKAVYNYAPVAAGPGKTDLPGVSAFVKDEDGAVFHTYSTYGRGLDILNAAYQWIDLAPKGRDEDSLPGAMAWVRYHDEYAKTA